MAEHFSWENSKENPARFFIQTFPVGPLKCNCTIVGDTETGQAIVVDPGGNIDKILSVLRKAGLHTVVQILHTHAHFDHFLASGELREQTQAPLCLHPDDNPLWLMLEQQCALFGVPYQPVPPPDHALSHEEELQAGNVKGLAIWTPGHSPGSMSFWFPKLQLLLAGDTLFRRGVGRTDLWGGDTQQIVSSIRNRLFSLDETATVVTGHGPSTTLGEEIRFNPYVCG